MSDLTNITGNANSQIRIQDGGSLDFAVPFVVDKFEVDLNMYEYTPAVARGEIVGLARGARRNTAGSFTILRDSLTDAAAYTLMDIAYWTENKLAAVSDGSKWATDAVSTTGNAYQCNTVTLTYVTTYPDGSTATVTFPKTRISLSYAGSTIDQIEVAFEYYGTYTRV